MAPHDLTERAAQLYWSLTCATFREGYEDPDNDIAVIAGVLKQIRQDALREAMEIVALHGEKAIESKYNVVVDGRFQFRAERICQDIADALARLASEGG